MAYSNSPVNSTYKTVPVQFVSAPNYRQTNLNTIKDVDIQNMYWDRVSNENQERWVALKKRFGITDTGTSMGKSNASDPINGYFTDESGEYIYWATLGKVYFATSFTTDVTLVQTFTDTASRYVGFSSFLTTSGTRYVVFTNGLELYYSVVGTGTATEVTDAQLPAPHLPFPVFIDGYLFLAKQDSGDIYNSDFDDPSSWTAGNFITTEISPDWVLRIAKLKNYLVAFGENEIEFFYNAAYVSGSPMGRNESYNLKIRYIAGLQQYADKLFFIGAYNNGSPQVFAMENGQAKVVSNSTVERTLQNDQTVTSEFTVGKNVGHILSQDGHTFYVINQTRTEEDFLVWALDLTSGFWYRWTSGDNNYEVFFDAVFTTEANTTFVNSYTKANFAELKNTIYQDYGVNFNCIYQTDDLTFGTSNWKSCHRLFLNTDMPLDTGSTSNVSITWSDNDWLSSVTARNLNVASVNSYITQLGNFRKRSFRFTYADNYPIRFYGMELDLNVGNT